MSELKPTYRPDIDGLRAIAVTAVVLFHAGISGISSGFIGVDVFFVISGFLIGGIIIRDLRAKQFSYANFYARRARRILPALIAAVLFTCLLGALLLDAKELHDLGATALTSLLATSNISFWHYQDYFALDSKLSPLLMTWSLGVEEQFYFVFPIIIVVVMRFIPRFTVATISVLTILSFAYSLWMTWHQPASAYYLLPSRAWELGAGALLAATLTRRVPHGIVHRSKRAKMINELLGAAGLISILVSALCFDEHVPFPGFLALLPVGGAVALIAAEGSSVNRHILSAKYVVFTGAISYSWYLWHWPLLAFVRILYSNAAPALALQLVVPISFLFAIASWKWIEQPFRHARTRSGKTLLRYGFALGLAATIPLIAKLTDGLPQRLSMHTQQLERVVAQGRGDCLATFDVVHPDLSEKCVALKADTNNIAVIGDSHAAALGPGLRELAHRNGGGIEVLTKSSCPPLHNVTGWQDKRTALAAACSTFMDDVFDRVINDRSIATVYIAGDYNAPIEGPGQRYIDLSQPTDLDQYTLFRRGLLQAVQNLTKAGKHVVIVQDVPHLKFDPVLAGLNREMKVRGWFADIFTKLAGRQNLQIDNAPVEPNDPHIRAIVDEAGRLPGAETIDPAIFLCPAQRCQFLANGELLYIDKHHLSSPGAALALGLAQSAKLDPSSSEH